jgi:hypothetical protein
MAVLVGNSETTRRPSDQSRGLALLARFVALPKLLWRVLPCSAGGPNKIQTLTLIISKSLWRCYINTTTVFLDIIHRPVFISNTTFRRLDYVSVFRWNLLSWTQLTELVPISGHWLWLWWWKKECLCRRMAILLTLVSQLTKSAPKMRVATMFSNSLEDDDNYDHSKRNNE